MMHDCTTKEGDTGHFDYRIFFYLEENAFSIASAIERKDLILFGN